MSLDRFRPVSTGFDQFRSRSIIFEWCRRAMASWALRGPSPPSASLGCRQWQRRALCTALACARSHADFLQ
eukprot:15433271-Alexandrium_andersonii.AAC.1